jgi:PD-(D/E)XK nuclease superfamily
LERGTIKISNSEIQSFKDCERKWYLTYYRELAPASVKLVGPLALGTKIHLILEGVYEADWNKETALEMLGELYESDRLKLDEESISFKEDSKSLDKEQDLAHAMIEGFFDWREEEGLDAGYELHSIEEVIEVETPFPGVYLRGKLDQRVRRLSDGAILFNDWKTTQTFNDRWMLQLNEQMKFYHLLEILTGEELTAGALYTMLRKVKRTANAKPPFYQREEVRHNQAELDNFYRTTMVSVKRIVEARKELDAGVDMHDVVPPRPSRDCSWKCPFTVVCPMFDDGSRVEDAISDLFITMDPHERYAREENDKSD